jgi:Ca2+/H+ antiporter, TMEM165/GDT1 family
MEAFLVSTGVVALAEIGDKTQLLALLLAVRYRRPWPLLLGILLATLLNHALAGWLGQWVSQLLSPAALRWLLGGSFLAIAAWMLVPDRLTEDETTRPVRGWGVLGVSFVAFFVAEMGDKTQIATVALSAQYATVHGVSFWLVVLGTTLGMMIANAPVVFLGGRAVRRLPVALMQRLAAAVFAILGLITLLDPIGAFDMGAP